MLHRVKEEGGRYYPQYRLFFIWMYISYILDNKVYFDTNKEAAHFSNTIKGMPMYKWNSYIMSLIKNDKHFQ